MLRRINKPELKNLLLSNDSVNVFVGNFQNEICFGTPYSTTISNIDQVEDIIEDAKRKGWKGNLKLFIKDK